MNDPSLKCPKCGAEVPLTESLAAPMVAAVRTEMQSKIDVPWLNDGGGPFDKAVDRVIAKVDKHLPPQRTTTEGSTT